MATLGKPTTPWYTPGCGHRYANTIDPIKARTKPSIPYFCNRFQNGMSAMVTFCIFAGMKKCKVLVKGFLSFLIISLVSLTTFTGCLGPEDPEDNKTPDHSKPGEFDPRIRAADSLFLTYFSNHIHVSQAWCNSDSLAA